MVFLETYALKDAIAQLEEHLPQITLHVQLEPIIHSLELNHLQIVFHVQVARIVLALELSTLLLKFAQVDSIVMELPKLRLMKVCTHLKVFQFN